MPSTSDEVLFDQRGVTVTKTRLTSRSFSVPLAEVTDAHVALHQRADTSSIARIARGMLGFTALYLISRFGFAPRGQTVGVGTVTWVALAVIVASIVTLVWARPRLPEFVVYVVTGGGERAFFHSTDRELAETVANSIRAGLARR